MPQPGAEQPVAAHMPVRFAQVDLYRACALCDHGAAGHCRRDRTPTPVATERATGGACGPEARHMRIGGWDLVS